MKPLLISIFLLPIAADAGITSIPIENPSFQADAFSGVGYASQNGGSVTGWSLDFPGAIGITGIDQPGGAHFIDGAIVDGTRAGFIQGTGSLSQSLNGLVSGRRHVFQGWFRPRNCCGDSPVFSVEFDGQPLVSSLLLPAGDPWRGFSVDLVARAESAELRVRSHALLGGDASLALDNIQVFQLDGDHVNIFNPSFESGLYFAPPGYQGAIAGWTISGTGGAGYNYAGNTPFADNGDYPEGNTVAFIQNTGSLSQMLTGLTLGQPYLLELDYNARAGTGSGQISVDLGGTNLLSATVIPVGAGAWHRLSAPWVADGDSALLSISGIQVGGDSAITFDNITLRAIPEPSTTAAAVVALTGLALRRRHPAP